jgi:hypothetical protein
VSSSIRPSGDFYHGEGQAEDDAAAVAALRAAFARLQPQGGDAWNFLAAFTHLGDRYGPYQPGASTLSALLDPPASPPAGGRRRLRPHRSDAAAAPDLDLAMAQVVEAFRFLSARVRTLEERLARQDHPVDGDAWLMPARELGGWVEPVAGRIVAAAPEGEVLHGDCGEGALLRALARAGVTARGAEPRGTVALGALARGLPVVIAEVADELAARAPGSLGGLVLSGVVDRCALHALLLLLAQSRRALGPGAPLVVVASEPGTEAHLTPPARDLLRPRFLHAQTWEVLLARAGFVDVETWAATGDLDMRFALSASVPR